MAGYDMDELMSVKNSYQGTRFQWVKCSDKTRLGTVVTVSDVVPATNGMFIAVLSDGARCSTEQLTANLMMLLDDQQPMSIAEIMSINQIPDVDPMAIAAALPPELRETSTIVQQIRKDVPVATQPQVPGQPQIIRQILAVDTTSLFGQFSLDDTDVTLVVSLKLPSKSLLKLMYTNSQDKDQFINQLTVYINNNIQSDSIKDSVKRMMGQDKKKRTDEQSTSTSKD